MPSITILLANPVPQIVNTHIFKSGVPAGSMEGTLEIADFYPVSLKDI
ncbi:MAG: hypothetical protein ACYDDB_01385 [bacterium]